jgi:hypothetical protein
MPLRQARHASASAASPLRWVWVALGMKRLLHYPAAFGVPQSPLAALLIGTGHRLK